MTKRQSHWMQMCGATLTVLEVNAQKIAPYPAITARVKEVADLKARIENSHETQTSVARGKTEQREDAKDALLDALDFVRHPLNSHARKTARPELRAKVDQPPSELRSLRVNDLITVSKMVLQEAVAALPDLADYGVTAESTDRLQQAIALYSETAVNRDGSISERSGARQSIEDLIEQAEDILSEDLDKLLLRFRTGDPDFYNIYTNARKVRTVNGKKANDKEAAPSNGKKANGTESAPAQGNGAQQASEASVPAAEEHAAVSATSAVAPQPEVVAKE